MQQHKRRDRRDGFAAKRRPVDDPVPPDVWAQLKQERQNTQPREGLFRGRTE